jgi:hypothetical protein
MMKIQSIVCEQQRSIFGRNKHAQVQAGSSQTQTHQAQSANAEFHEFVSTVLLLLEGTEPICTEAAIPSGLSSVQIRMVLLQKTSRPSAKGITDFQQSLRADAWYRMSRRSA